MKNSLLKRLCHLGSSALILASLAWSSISVPELREAVPALRHEGISAKAVAERSGGAEEPASVDDRSSQYVQEPLGRSSFRPDFSSALRRANQRNNYAMLRAFNDVVVDARMSTVLVSAGGVRVALGAIVDAEGWIATKASQLPSSGTIRCRLYDNSEYVAEIVRNVVDIDLALLRIDRADLTSVQWDLSDIPQRGTWLATTDVDKMPSAVGVVSAGIQRIQPSKAVLGVHLADSTEGAAVTLVLPGSGAEEAGLRVNDNIVSVNGINVSSKDSFQSAISPARGGQSVKLLVSRGDRTFDTEARLMDLTAELLDSTEMEVNGRVSARATGFNRVFLHDTVLDPNQCGGPLCNLDGKVVGLNIARAGRVASYALPADVVRPVLEGLIAEAKLVSRPVSHHPN